MRLLFTEDSEFQEIVFDATLKEAPSHTSTVTRHPVTRGIKVTDHVITEPDALAVEVFVTNTPIRNVNADGAQGQITSFKLETTGRAQRSGAVVSETGEAKEAQYEETTNAFAAQVLAFSTPFDRVKAVYAALDMHRKKATLFTIETKYRVYESFVIALLEAPRESATGDALTFTVNFEEVRQVEVQYVDTPEPLETRAERNRPRGNTATTPATQQQESVLRAGMRAAISALTD